MEESVTFRPVLAEDVPALVRLRLATRVETYRDIYPSEWIEGFDFAASEQRFQKMAVDPAQHLYLICVGEMLAGYFCYGAPQEATMPQDAVCLNMLYLLRAFQRRGIGARVLRQIRDDCVAQGRDRFYNGCNMHNESAMRFYRALGGRVIAEYGGHTNKALDQAVFEHLVER